MMHVTHQAHVRTYDMHRMLQDTHIAHLHDYLVFIGDMPKPDGSFNESRITREELSANTT